MSGRSCPFLNLRKIIMEEKKEEHNWDRSLNKLCPFSPIYCKKCGKMRQRDGNNGPCKKIDDIKIE